MMIDDDGNDKRRGANVKCMAQHGLGRSLHPHAARLPLPRSWASPPRLYKAHHELPLSNAYATLVQFFVMSLFLSRAKGREKNKYHMWLPAALNSPRAINSQWNRKTPWEVQGSGGGGGVGWRGSASPKDGRYAELSTKSH